MVALNFILSSLLFVAGTQATPLPTQEKTSALNRATVLGTANGVLDPAGAYRFTVKYGSASRWAPSTVVSSWGLPTSSANASDLPLACPQPDVDSSAFTEDCLSMILYVPPSLTLTSAAPTMMWVHGGSFIVGSASAPGLDGSKLAIATQSIVAVVQYRLGALGFLSPDGNTNLAVKDLVTALQFLKKVVPAFGGSTSKITVAGQSSGANMIRALLAAPSASSLFRSAILQSDPMNFGFLSPSTQQALQGSFNGLVSCGATDATCRNALSLDTIIDAQMNVFGNAVSIAPAAGSNQPIRPVTDESFITSPLDSTAAFPAVSKPLLLTTVKNEATFAIYGNFESPLPEDAFYPVCDATFGSDRAEVVVSAPFYVPVPSAVDGSVDARVQLEAVGTDYLWKCSGWTFARNWVQNGGTVFTGEYIVGASYPGNEAVPQCTQPGVICHQDDIQIVFGTVSNPTSAQATLTTQIQKYYKAFLATGNPNTSGAPTWSAATTSDVHALQLGGSGEVPVGACVPTFWGQDVEYDYQFFNL
ncbi:Alpha/Beta hydrolase protein [Crucibulum laeve]|uniref:Carboxylic ester hydrolase n=1 Tax=Crucibulum laeve TaxID=68775 RepID=A0A5C3MAG6_9AGAR|nr:Alpha/Beta hydrolase protein [Crucibulum laeve]